MWAGAGTVPLTRSGRLSDSAFSFRRANSKRDLELDASWTVGTGLSCRVSAHEGLCKEESFIPGIWG